MEATAKQINYIKKLDPTIKDEQLEHLTIKEASILIHKLKNNKPIQALEDKKETSTKNNKLDLSLIDFESLYKKYNAYTVDTTKSNYNNINGANCKSDLLNDSRKFKSFISNILKTEFKGLKFKIECSFKSYYNSYCNIILYIENPFKDYKEAEAETTKSINELIRYTNLDISYKKDNYSNYERKYLYNNYFKVVGITDKNYHTKNKGMINYLKDDVKKLYDFLYCLLNSYSYDHNDLMTDYFDYGLRGAISVYDETTTEEEREEAFKKCNSATDEEIEKLGAETEEEKKYINQKWMEYEAQLMKKIEEEKQERLKQQEAHEKYLKEKQDLSNDKNNYEIITTDLTIKGCKFSTWNKPCNFAEALEFIEQYPEYKGVGTVAYITNIINFKNETLFNLFKNNTLDDWEFLKNISGGCGYLKLVNNEYLEATEEEYKQLHESKKTPLEKAQDGYFWARKCILIQLNGNNKFLVDTEGFNYCRYIGVID